MEVDKHTIDVGTHCIIFLMMSMLSNIILKTMYCLHLKLTMNSHMRTKLRVASIFILSLAVAHDFVRIIF